MKSLIIFFIAAMLLFFYACSDNQDNKEITDIDSQALSISAKSQNAEQKTYQNPESSETITGFYGEDSKPMMLTFKSYPDVVQYFYNEGLICIIHTVNGEEGVEGTESKYYFKNAKLFHYIVNKEAAEITADVEKAVQELLAIESESLENLSNKSKGADLAQTKNPNGSLEFLNEFVDKSSYDVSENEILTSRLKAIVKNDDDYNSLISQLAYGDAIQKFNNAIIINGQVRQVIDEDGNQITFVSIIVADLAYNVLSVGMTDEEGNTSVFYTEAPGQKYPKQLVDWFTTDYRKVFKLEAQ